MGHILRRTLGSQVPLDLASGALGDHKIVGAAQQDCHSGRLSLGKVQVPVGRPVEHNRRDVSRVSHVDRVVLGVGFFPHGLTCATAQGPVPGNRVSEKDNVRVVCPGHVSIDPLKLPVPIAIFNSLGCCGAG